MLDTQTTKTIVLSKRIDFFINVKIRDLEHADKELKKKKTLVNALHVIANIIPLGR